MLHSRRARVPHGENRTLLRIIRPKVEMQRIGVAVEGKKEIEIAVKRLTGR